MAVSYFYEGNVIRIEMEGVYSLDEFRAAVLSALDDPACPARPLLMFDARLSKSLRKTSRQEIRGISDFLAGFKERFGERVATVVSNPLDWGLMRIGSVYAEFEGKKPGVFRNIEKARSWLLATPGFDPPLDDAVSIESEEPGAGF